MDFDFDLFVIGGGSGGVRAARIAASEGGARVALAEEFRMGGTCVIRGCVPKKLMVFAAGFPQQVQDAVGYGWEASIGAFDWPRFRQHLDVELARLEAAYRSGLVNAGVTIFDQRAVVVDPHTLRLGDGRTVSAKHILIATGGKPVTPPIEGAELAISSNEIFWLDQLPRRILIVGGGFIATEFACVMKGLGAEVVLIHRGDTVLRHFDREARGHISDAITAQGIEQRLGRTLTKLARSATGILAHQSDGVVEEFDVVLNATGREPNTAGLGLEPVGVKLGSRGQILVDGYSQTSVPSIFAVGDVTDRVNLTPVAIREGHAFADTMFKGTPRQADHDLIPMAVFTQPELGVVGMTEEAAAAEGPIEIYTTSFRPMQSLFAGRQDRSFFKLVVSATTRKVLGCHIVAPMAGELIQLVAIALRMGATKEDFDRTMAVHPTISEELVTMRNPVRRS